MNGPRAGAGQRPAKMAFFRTAEGVARTSAGEGAAGSGSLAGRAARLGQKLSTWRTLGPPGPAPHEASS